MKWRSVIGTVVLLMGAPSSAWTQLTPNLGGQRVGISALQFLKIGVGARGVAFGESFVAVVDDASALYWNPAGLGLFEENQAFAARTEYVVDIKHDFFGAVYHLSPQDALGLSVTSLHMDDMEITTETQPFGTGQYFRVSDLAVGLSYARRMTDQFSFGLTVKYVEETLHTISMKAWMVDLGTYYATGIGSLRFAVVISNFGGDAKPEGTVTLYDGSTENNFQSFSVPTVFKLGVAFDPIRTEEHRLITSLQLNHPNDNAEHVRLGVEYGFREQFFVRAGIKRTIRQPLFGTDGTSEEGYSLGAGVRADLSVTRVQADYAFTSMLQLGNVHRISLAFTY